MAKYWFKKSYYKFFSSFKMIIYRHWPRWTSGKNSWLVSAGWGRGAARPGLCRTPAALRAPPGPPFAAAGIDRRPLVPANQHARGKQRNVTVGAWHHGHGQAQPEEGDVKKTLKGRRAYAAHTTLLNELWLYCRDSIATTATGTKC